jgi:hypothetical protein
MHPLVLLEVQKPPHPTQQCVILGPYILGGGKNHSFLLCHLFPIMFLIIFLMVFSIPHGFQTIEHMENTLGTTSKTCLYYVPNVFSVCSIVPNPCAWPHVLYVIPMCPSDVLKIYSYVFTKMFLMLFSWFSHILHILSSPTFYPISFAQSSTLFSLCN